MATYKALGPDYRPVTIDTGSGGGGGTVDQTARDAAANALAVAQAAYNSYSQTTTVGTLKAANGSTASINFPTGGSSSWAMPGWTVFQRSTGDDDAELDRCIALASTVPNNQIGVYQGGGVWLGDGNYIIVLKKPHTIDPTKCCIQGIGAKIDITSRTFSSTANNNISTANQNAVFFLTTNNDSDPHMHQLRAWGGFRILSSAGSGAGSQYSIGFLANTPTAKMVASRITMYDVNMQGLDICFWAGNRTYLCSFYSNRWRSRDGTGIGFRFDAGMNDAGENDTWHSGIIGGGDLALQVYGQADLNFFGTSFDFCKRFLRGNPIITYTGCHFEINRSTVDSTTIPWYLENSSGSTFHSGLVHIIGGRVQISGPSGASSVYPPDYFVYLDDKSASFRVDNTHWYGQGGTSTGQFANDVGDVDLRLRGGDTKDLPFIISRNPRYNYMPGGGGFEQSDSVGKNAFCWVTSTDATNTTQWANAQVQILSSTEHSPAPAVQNVGNSRSLRVNKLGSGNAVFWIMCPFPARRIPGAMWYMKVSGAGSDASISVVPYSASVVQIGPDGIPIICQLEAHSTGVPLSVPTGDIGWTKMGLNMGNWAQSSANYRDGMSPSHANYMLFKIDLSARPNGTSVWLDDMVVNAL